MYTVDVEIEVFSRGVTATVLHQTLIFSLMKITSVAESDLNRGVRGVLEGAFNGNFISSCVKLCKSANGAIVGDYFHQSLLFSGMVETEFQILKQGVMR